MATQQRALNKKLSLIFRQRGLTLRPDAMQPLYDILQDDEAWEETLKALVLEVKTHGPKNGHIDASAVKGAVDKLRVRTTQKAKLSLEVIDAFSMQPLRFDTQRRALVAEAQPTSLHAGAPSKSSMYAVRLAMIEQRTRRHTMFKPPVLTHSVQPRQHIEITSIDALLGRSGSRVVLGMLAELEEGVFHLEDGYSSIPVDLSEAAHTHGLFTRYSIVLAEGDVLPSGVFKVRTLGMPPPEPRLKSIDSLGNLDPLRSGDGATSPSSVLDGASASRDDAPSALASVNTMVVMLSDVWLDDPNVLRRLAELFRGYEQVGASPVGSGRTSTPLAAFMVFVLCGNFASPSLAAATALPSQLRACFRSLSQILQKTPLLARHAHFVLVPGPDDPCVGAPDVLPRAGLPRSLCPDLLDGISHCELTTSPARLVINGQVVVVSLDRIIDPEPRLPSPSLARP